MSQALTLTSTIIQEIISAAGMPGAAFLGHIFSAHQEKRSALASDILLNRLAQGEIDISEVVAQSEVIGVIHKYALCANQGVARINLDLLAQSIVGELKGGSIFPDNFQKYMNILSSLTRDEILVIGTYYRCATTISEEQKRNGTSFWGVRKPTTWQRFMRELVPSSIATMQHVEVVCGSLMRTGLTAANSPQMGENPSHTFTILHEELCKLINFEEAYALYPEY